MRDTTNALAAIERNRVACELWRNGFPADAPRPSNFAQDARAGLWRTVAVAIALAAVLALVCLADGAISMVREVMR